MSLKGRINRGIKWYARNRDADGNLTSVVTENPSKMRDVNAYLEYKKKLEEEKQNKSKGKK